MLPFRFRPTFNKHAGQTCNGMFLHIRTSSMGSSSTSAAATSAAGSNNNKTASAVPAAGDDEEEACDVDMFEFGLVVLLHSVLYYPNEFLWREPSKGYEYDYSHYAIDLILGTKVYRQFFDGVRNESASIRRSSSAASSSQSNTPLLPREEEASWSAFRRLESESIQTLYKLINSSRQSAASFCVDTKRFWLY